MKIGGSGLTRFDFGAKKSSLVGDRAAADARRRQVGQGGEGRGAMIGAHFHACPFVGDRACSLTLPTANRASGSCRCPRRGDRHDLRDLTVAIRFEGDYDESYTDGDNSDVLPTDTMKNTVYALAAQQPVRRARDRSACRSRGTSSSAIRGCDASASILTEHPWGRIRHRRSRARPGVRADGPGSADGDASQADRERDDRRRRRRRSGDPEVRPTRRSRAFCATSSRRCPRPAIGCWRRR